MTCLRALGSYFFISLLSGVVRLFLVVVEKWPVPAVDSSLIFSRIVAAPGLDLAALAQLFEHRVDALLVDDAHARVGSAQPHPALFAFHPETAVLQVRVEPAYGLVVGVGNVVSHLGLLARYLADARHAMLRGKGAHYRAKPGARSSQRRGPPRIRRGTSQQPAFGKGHRATACDDEMVEHLNIDQGERAFQRAREDLVGMTRLGDTGGVVMRENHGRRGMSQRALHHLARVDTRLGQGPAEQLLVRDDAMLRIQEQYHEDFLLAPGEREA